MLAFDRSSSQSAMGRCASTSIALALACICLLIVHNGAVIPVGYDESVYLGVSDSISELGVPRRSDNWDRTVFFNNPPLVPYLAAPIRALDGSVSLSRAVHVLLLLAPLVWFLVSLARIVGGSTASLFALLLLGTSHAFLEHASMVRLDTPIGTFFCAMLYFSVAALGDGTRSRGTRATVPLAICTTLAALTNYQSVLIPLSIGVAALLVAGWRGARRVVLPMVLGGLAGVVLWFGLLGQLGVPPAEPFESNLGRGIFDSPATDAYVNFAKNLMTVSLVLVLPVAYGVRCLRRSPVIGDRVGGQARSLLLVSCVVFAAASVALAAYTRPPDVRYILKGQPALILLATALAWPCLQMLRTRQFAVLMACWLLLLAVTLALPNRTDVRVGATVIGVGTGLLMGMGSGSGRAGLVLLVLLLGAHSLSPWRMSSPRNIDNISAQEYKAAIEAGAWFQEHVEEPDPVCVLARPWQLFCAPVAQVVPNMPSPETMADTMSKAKSMIVGSAALERFNVSDPEAAARLAEILQADFLVRHRTADYVVYLRRVP